MIRRAHLLWRDVKLGILISLAVFLFAVGIVAVGGSGSGFWIPKDIYYTDLPQASGLYVGSLVMIDGVEVGTVRAIRLNPSGHGVRVEFKVARGMKDRIREDSVVSVENLGLLGDRYLNIRSGSRSKAERPPRSVLPGVPAGDYTVTLQKLADSIPHIQKTLANLADVTDRINRGEGTIGALLTDPTLAHDLKSLIHDLRSGHGSLGLLLKDESLYRDMATLMESLNNNEGLIQSFLADPESARLLRDSVRQLHDFLALLQNDQGTVGKLVTDDHLYGEITRLTQETADLMAKIQKGDNTLGLLLNDRKLYDQVQASVTDVRSLIEEIRKHPKKYLSVKVALIAF